MAASVGDAISYAALAGGGRALARGGDIGYIGWACFNLTPG